MREVHGAAEGSAAVGRVGGTTAATEKLQSKINHHRHMVGRPLPAAALAKNPGAIEVRLKAFADPNMVEPPPSV